MSVMYANIKGMSDNYNQDILDRARDSAEELAGTTAGYIVNKAIKDYEQTGDIEDLKYRLDRVEGDLAQEYFYEAGVFDGYY